MKYISQKEMKYIPILSEEVVRQMKYNKNYLKKLKIILITQLH